MITKSASKMEMTITLVLQEDEARALEAVCGYGPVIFKKWFYKTHGEHYLKPHEAGLVSLFKSVKEQLPLHLTKADKVRQLLNIPYSQWPAIKPVITEGASFVTVNK